MSNLEANELGNAMNAVRGILTTLDKISELPNRALNNIPPDFPADWSEELKEAINDLVKAISLTVWKVEQIEGEIEAGIRKVLLTNQERTALNSYIEDLPQHYNAVLENHKERESFMQFYKPIRIGTINAMERRRDPSIEPDFRTTDDGDYYAIAVNGKNVYSVVPRFDLTFQRSIYGPGAMGMVFECPGYDPRFRYRAVTVVKPALFGPDPARQRWIMKEKGALNLGQGSA